MRVFVTGSTGVLGHRLVDRLTDRGHEVYGLVRDDRGADLVRTRGGTPCRGDVLDRGSLEEAVPAVDAIVHAATAIPTETKPSEADWQRNDEVRLEGARNLVAVAGDSVDRVLFPSVVWVARQPDGSSFDESAQRHPDRTTRSAAATEDVLDAQQSAFDFETTILRCGFFYAPDADHTRQFGEGLLAGRFPIVGRGLLGRRDGTLSFLHADDAARAFATAIDAEISGCFHVVDDRPATLAEFLTALAEGLGASPPRRIPAWLAKLFVGSEVTALLTKPMATTNDRFCAATGWEPTYPTYREGLAQVVDSWIGDGTIEETADGYLQSGTERSGTEPPTRVGSVILSPFVVAPIMSSTPETIAGVDHVDCSGKQALVTGSTSGIGRSAALALGRLGADVIVHGRDSQAGAAVVDELVESGVDATFVEADFASVEAVEDLAATVRSETDGLDILVNNAGGMFREGRLTDIGVEYTFHINHLSPYLLTARLLDHLTEGARVVTTSSGAHNGVSLDLDRVQSVDRYSGMWAYSHSKLANILFATELARRLDATGREVTSNSLHPGAIPGSGFARFLPGPLPTLIQAFDMVPGIASVADGAAEILLVAVSPRTADASGEYFSNLAQRTPSAPARDREAARELWTQSAAFLEIDEPLAEATA